MSHCLGITLLTTTRSFPQPSLRSGGESHSQSSQKFIGHSFVITGDFLFSCDCTAPLRKPEFAPLIQIFLFSFFFFFSPLFFASHRTFWVKRSAPLEKSLAPQEGGWRGSSRKCLSLLKKEDNHVKEIIKVCFFLVSNYAHKSRVGPAKTRE